MMQYKLYFKNTGISSSFMPVISIIGVLYNQADTISDTIRAHDYPVIQAIKGPQIWFTGDGGIPKPVLFRTALFTWKDVNNAKKKNGKIEPLLLEAFAGPVFMKE